MQLDQRSLFKQGIYLDRMTPTAQLSEFARTVWPVKTRFDLVRYGNDHDGGYLLPDDLDDIQVCFSPGVDVNASFEIDLKNRRGIESHQADFSVDGPPMKFKPKSFTKKFLGSVDDAVFTKLDTWVRGTDDFLSPGDFILQMDIEGGEYVALLGASTEVLKRFRVISLEVHDAHAWGQPQFFAIVKAMFAQLLHHFWVVHNHPNNWAGIVNLGGFIAPRVFELTLLRRDRAASLGYCESFPHPLDRSNRPNGKDLPLPVGWYSPGAARGIDAVAY